MTPLTSPKGWKTAPVLFFIMCAALVAIWAVIPPERLIPLFDNKGKSPVELMTLPLFALLIPLTWLCSPFSGSCKRRAWWNFDVSVLAIMAIVRETDLHKIAFAKIWPEVSANFTGTVFKMKFLKAAEIPIAPKIFVGVFFAAFFLFTVVTFLRYIIPLIKGIFKLAPLCWTWAVFGGTSVMVLVVDRLPAFLRHHGFDGPLLDKHTGSVAALMKVFEEGGEMMMALFALMAVVQAHILLQRKEAEEAMSLSELEPVDDEAPAPRPAPFAIGAKPVVTKPHPAPVAAEAAPPPAAPETSAPVLTPVTDAENQ